MERLKKVDWSNIVDNIGLIMVLLGLAILIIVIGKTLFDIIFKAWITYPTGIQITVIAFIMIGIGGFITQVAKLIKRE